MIAAITQMELVGNSKVGVMPKRADPLLVARQIACNKNTQGTDDAFSVVNLDHIVDRFELWRKELPMIEPFYAVKCNSDPVLLRCLAALGTGFDCASREEIDSVMDMGVSADRVVYANPVKTRSFITHAKERGVRMMTFDNSEELLKISTLHPNAELILRIAVSDPTATCQLNLKFGCDPELEAPRLLKRACELDLNVVGISFHVGSGCNDPTAYHVALQYAKSLSDLGTALGFDMKLVDMGGGYPGEPGGRTSFEQIAEVIRGAVDEFFDNTTIRLIAEPGRYFAAGAFSLITNIIHAANVPASKITKNDADADRDGYMYYINDGAYGSFNCILFDHVQPSGQPLFEMDDVPQYTSTIWGPTCDSIDVVEKNKWLPKMEIGDWLFYKNMGAYTYSAASTFNGFARPTPVYVISQSMWDRIKSSKHI